MVIFAKIRWWFKLWAFGGFLPKKNFFPFKQNPYFLTPTHWRAFVQFSYKVNFPFFPTLL